MNSNDELQHGRMEEKLVDFLCHIYGIITKIISKSTIMNMTFEPSMYG